MAELEDEFSLGDSDGADEFSLGEQRPLFSSEETSEEENELERVYSVLKIDELPERVDFKEFFKSNPEVFKLFGVEYVTIPSPEQIADFEAKCDNLIKEANDKWRSTENRNKIHGLQDGLETLLGILRNKRALENFRAETVRLLSDKFGDFLREKISRDNVLNVSQILELMDFAFSILLLPNNPSGKKAVIDTIKAQQKKENFEIEPFSRTFIRLVQEKSEFERFDTEICRNELFKLYKKLSNINEQVNGEKNNLSDSELFDEMNSILHTENLFSDNGAFYLGNFFLKEKENSKYNFSLPLNNEYYHYLKGTAIHIYQFTDEQWNEFSRIQGLKKEDDASVAFIMGPLKASTLPEIAELITENPNMALSRIRAGDVETYLYHIGQRDMAKKLSQIKEELKADTDILVQAVSNLLNGADLSKSDEDETKPTDSLIPLIERNATVEEIVSYLLRRKQYESLNKRILSENSEEHQKLEEFLIRRGFSFIKICLNYLAMFPKENNAQVYKNMYETYADYVQKKLTETKDELTTEYILKPIMEMMK